MKLPLLLTLAMGMSVFAQEQPKSLLPLPPFHESWTAEEQAAIVQFCEHLETFCRNELLNKEEIPLIISHLHAVVSTGTCPATTTDGDTMARVAAMVDEADAMMLFLRRGENVNAVLSNTDPMMPMSLASEVIWAEGLIGTRQSAADRVALMQELQKMGWDPHTHAESVIFAMPLLCAEHQDVSPLFNWFFSLNYKLTAEQKHSIYNALLIADGCTPIVQRLVEQGEIAVNEPIGEASLLPLQQVCSKPIFDKEINLSTLELLLAAGADPNLILVEEDTGTGSDEYDPDGYEEDDLPRDDMAGFSTPIEMVFDHYRSELSEGNKKREKNYLAAIDLLLIYGAELDIEEDEHNDEDAESTAYTEVRKRLNMTPEQLLADFKRLTE